MNQNLQYIGYVADVTEYERGWGCRPDGFIVCLEKQKGIEMATRDQGHVWSTENGSEFSSAGDFKMVALTEEGYMDLKDREHGRAWQPNNMLKKYVKDM
ncbi:hypothetical protein ZPAH1_orf00367 [Aeromonas phage ZPAH1]|nr:hypothetical protein ASwh1_321 [Aeromonas phage Aswh_1]QQG34129.1 hypothetical protein ZPAH1_orf00367 [Aeromonas phage ZPAH1]